MRRYFNGAQSAQAKAKFARDTGLAGVMVWEIGQDTQDVTSLLSAIAAEANGPEAAKKHIKKHRKYQKIMDGSQGEL
jgi:GH18 family chitinase